MTHGRVLTVLLTGLVLVASAAPAAQGRNARLRSFGSCAALVDYARSHAARGQGIAVGVGGRPQVSPQATAAPGTAPAAADGGKGIEGVSGTNVQEQGVDEPDVVKAGRNRLFAIAGGTLRAVDTSGDGAPRLVGSLGLDAGSGGYGGGELLLRGNRLLVLSNRFSGGPIPLDGGPVSAAGSRSIAPYPYGHQTALLTEIDVSDEAAMRVVRTQEIDGRYVSARLTNGTARVVIASTPRAFGFERPQDGRARTDWSPVSTTTVTRTKAVQTKPLVPCRDVRRPIVFAGLGTLTVLTVDLDKGLPSVDTDAVMGDAETVYASGSSLFVATERWVDPSTRPVRVPAGRSTAVHRFDIRSGSETAYRGSGNVRGYLLGQYALSDSGGVLRVATTEMPSFLQDGSAPQSESESFVSVFEEGGAQLDQIGEVGGLGRGEQIRAVRFVGDRAYVVTFRQVDPLYVVDLSTPTAPKVAGSLDLLGYSAYLHPVGDDLLLGIGQDATPQGRTRGTQLSLFDVADPAKPRRIDHVVLGNQSSSQAEYDPHAFLYWAPRNLAVVPLTQGVFSGAIAYRVTRTTGIASAGRISHASEDDGGAAIGRAVISGDRLLTQSDAGVLANRLDGLARIGFAAFPATPSAGEKVTPADAGSPATTAPSSPGQVAPARSRSR